MGKNHHDSCRLMCGKYELSQRLGATPNATSSKYVHSVNPESTVAFTKSPSHSLTSPDFSLDVISSIHSFVILALIKHSS